VLIIPEVAESSISLGSERKGKFNNLIVETFDDSLHNISRNISSTGFLHEISIIGRAASIERKFDVKLSYKLCTEPTATKPADLLSSISDSMDPHVPEEENLNKSS